MRHSVKTIATTLCFSDISLIMRLLQVILLLVLIGFPALANSTNEKNRRYDWIDSEFNHSMPDSTGLGMLYGRSAGELEAAFVWGGDRISLPTQHKDTSIFFDRTYGLRNIRLEIGSGLGLALITTYGYQILGALSDEWFFPHIGFEPFNLFTSVNTNAKRKDFIEWLPSGSLGGHFVFSGINILILGRGGLAMGTLGNGGARTAVGTGLYLSTPEKLGFSGEITSILGDGGNVVASFYLASLLYNLPNRNITLGLRYEGLDSASVGTWDEGQSIIKPSVSEKRLLLTIAFEI